MINPMVKELGYPALSSMGRIVPPIAATVAWVEPETPPNSVQLAVAVMGKPPGICPTKDWTIRISFSADLPEVIRFADKINIGMQTMAEGVTPVKTCCTKIGNWNAGI